MLCSNIYVFLCNKFLISIQSLNRTWYFTQNCFIIIFMCKTFTLLFKPTTFATMLTWIPSTNDWSLENIRLFFYFHFNVIFILFIIDLENGLLLKMEKLTQKQDAPVDQKETRTEHTMHLVQKGKEIHNITGCNVFVNVVLDWPKWRKWCFKSQHYQDLHLSINSE